MVCRISCHTTECWHKCHGILWYQCQSCWFSTYWPQNTNLDTCFVGNFQQWFSIHQLQADMVKRRKRERRWWVTMPDNSKNSTLLSLMKYTWHREQTISLKGVSHLLAVVTTPQDLKSIQDHHFKIITTVTFKLRLTNLLHIHKVNWMNKKLQYVYQYI